jgi:glycosyltransferase involved in cell wall biosynthesis
MKVSVCMITYNHERFIREAIDSVLMQKGDFDSELVIAEDCSTDSTRDILLEYQKKHPDRIRLLLNQKNIGGNHNLIHALSECKGEYIALLEGDDFWTSPEKLHKQVEYMDTHPECSLCFHKAIIFYDSNNLKKESLIPSRKIKPVSTIEDLLQENFIPTLSVMYRRKNIPSIPEHLTGFWMFDWPLHILVAKTGKIGYLDDTMGKYRRHDTSVCSKTGDIQCYLGIADMLRAVNAYLDNRYDSVIKSTIARQYYDLSIIYWEQNDLPNAKKFFRESLRTKRFNRQISMMELGRLCVRLLASSVKKRTNCFNS